MSSEAEPSEHRAGFRISFRLALWYALFFVVTVAGIYALSYHLIDSALEREWGYVERTVVEEPGMRGPRLRVLESRGRARPSAEFAASIDEQFRTTFFRLVLPIVVLGLAGGALLTYWSARPIRRVVTTVQQILRTGRIEQRVPTDAARAEVDDVAQLFNRMLDQIDGLLRAQRESLDNVAHDLRTPLTRMRATAERALMAGEDPEMLRDTLADCLEESEHILKLVDTLMDIAEAQTGAMRLAREPVALPALIRDVIELYSLVAEDQGVDVHAELPDNLDVSADGGRIRQALANVLDNAIKYTKRGGTITLTARRTGEFATVVIRDDGRGISREDLPHVWDRLYRGDRSRGERGLGLGLSVVRAIIEAHGGTVDVASQPGMGSTFTLRIPVDDRGEL